MKIIINILLLSFFSFSNIAQEIDYDTLTDAEVEHEFYGKTKFEFKLSRDRSVMSEGYQVKGSTWKIGVRFKKHYKVGMALFFSDNHMIEAVKDANVQYYKLSFSGIGMYTEYVIFKNYRFEYAIPVSLLSVKAKAKAFNVNDDHMKYADTISNSFGVLSCGFSATYNLNYWFGVGGGIGYRFSFSDNPDNNEILGSPFYSFGVKIQLGKLHKTMFHHEYVLKLKSIHFRDRKPEKSAHYNNKYHKVAKRKAARNNR